MKYFIVPATSIAGEVEAETREDAMVDFAATMDLDMNAYFRAVTKEEMEKALQNTVIGKKERRMTGISRLNDNGQ